MMTDRDKLKICLDALKFYAHPIRYEKTKRKRALIMQDKGKIATRALKMVEE